jgi:hypothetical protein
MTIKSYQTLTMALMMTSICLIDCLATTLYWQHEAVVHNSAFWEPNSWGIVKFKWNDVSYAQTPFQDEGWQKIQTALFNQKLKSLDIK